MVLGPVLLKAMRFRRWALLEKGVKNFSSCSTNYNPSHTLKVIRLLALWWMKFCCAEEA